MSSPTFFRRVYYDQPPAADAYGPAGEPEATPEGRGVIHVGITVNGVLYTLDLDPRATLLDTLRERLGLTGTKIGCDHGQCGACTVLLDGRRTNSCMTFMAQADGADVVTVEGLAHPDGGLHPMQQAFIDHDAFQCGYCTPGQIVSAIACIEEGHAGSGAEIREYMSGNLCRCGAYPNIVRAIEQVRDQEQE